MKRRFYFSIVVLLLIYGCKKIDNGVPLIKSATLTITTPNVVSFDGPLASCTSSLDLSGGAYTYGFCYSLTRNPTIPGINNTSTNYMAGNFSALITNVQFGKKYYIRAFVTNGFATSYSNQDSFFVPLYIFTDTVKNITARSFDVKLYTLPAIADSITEKGVCYDTIKSPDIMDLKTITTLTDTGTILLHVGDSLRAGKTYYLRSYCIANGRALYGNEVTFKSAGYKGSYGYIVFDKGDTTNGWRYVEAALDTITRANAIWGCSGDNVPGTLGTIGAGLINSNTIAAVCTDTLAAANICINLTLKTRTDWYLPSVDELKALYQLTLSSVISNNLLLFSSTQASANDGYVVDFSTGLRQQIVKSSAAAFIWPVRRFK